MMASSTTMIAISTWMTEINSDNKLKMIMSTILNNIMRRGPPPMTSPTSMTLSHRSKEQNRNISNKLHRLYQQASKSRHNKTPNRQSAKAQVRLALECLTKCQMLSFSIKCNK